MKDRDFFEVCCRLLQESSRGKEIYVFDFDDTLVRTSSKIHLTTVDNRGKKNYVSLTPAEYASYTKKPNDVFDYSDFERVIDPKLITPTYALFRRVIQDFGHENVFILTARGAAEPIRKYLESLGVRGIRIFAVGSSDPREKARQISEEIISRGIKIVNFYDDAAKNIEAVRELRDKFPLVKIRTIRLRSPNR